MVQNLYSERELSIKLLLGEKTNISPFPATHTYIKLTFVSFFSFFFFWTFPLHNYDEMWASVMKAVPKLDESESSQMVLK